jgi:hypothetical protein
MFIDKRAKQPLLTARRYFADWRDEKGKRKRKGFITAQRAKQFQARMQSLTARKKAHARKESANLRKRGRAAATTAKSSRVKSRSCSPKSHPKHSHKRTSKKSSSAGTRASAKARTENTKHFSPNSPAQWDVMT